MAIDKSAVPANILEKQDVRALIHLLVADGHTEAIMEWLRKQIVAAVEDLRVKPAMLGNLKEYYALLHGGRITSLSEAILQKRTPGDPKTPEEFLQNALYCMAQLVGGRDVVDQAMSAYGVIASLVPANAIYFGAQANRTKEFLKEQSNCYFNSLLRTLA